MRSIAIRLLGPFQVTIDDVPVTGFAYAKVRALLAYLALEGRPHPRARLAALLWPEQPERAARASLSQALLMLRNALGDKSAERPVLLSDAQTVQLDPDSALEVDLTQFVAALGAAEAHAHRSWRTCARCSERLRQALDLYAGPFLADLSIADSEPFEEWASLQREHASQRVLSALERLRERAEWCGDYTDALEHARRLVAIEPWLEASQRTCMRLLALNGERAAALAQYRGLQALLANELAVEPEAATTALFEQIRRGDIAALQPQPPPYGVPVPPASLVGRGAELEAICARLREMSGRVLSLIGTGGIGKTRLALEAADTLRYDFEDGVFFVELAGVNNAALVEATIAHALGVQGRPRQPIDETLRDYLRAKQVLLVLDNFEHVVAAAPLVAALLAACPALTVLVTSRAPLNIRAEQQHILGPLDDGDAVRLFVARAHAAGAVLATDEADIAVYAAICRRLDWLPLAIELIAVRARMLSPLDLLQQLEQPLQALANGPQDGNPRHRSLRQAIRWSYELLDAEAQCVFRCLGVFAGGWSAAAAQAVLGESLATMPALETLTQASLVQQQVVAGTARFFLLETIREFALEELMSQQEAVLVQQRHVAYYAGFAMTAYVEVLRDQVHRWRAWVAAEQDNLRAAFGWAMQYRMYESALQLATGVWRFHWMGGYLREALDRLEAALPYREQAAPAVQANALRAAGTLATGLNDYGRARRWLEAAVELGWRMDDADVLQSVLTNLGYTLLEQGELDDARIHLEISLELARRAPDPQTAKFPLGMLAGVHLRQGDYARAQALSEEGLRLNRVRGDTEGTADALRVLASILNARGDAQRAREMCEEALSLHRSLNHELGVGQDYAVLGDIARGQGQAAAALEKYHLCLSLWQDRGNTVNSAAVLDSIAATVVRLGDAERGAALLGAAAAIREHAGVRLAAAEQAAYAATMQACSIALGDDAFNAAVNAGRGLSLAQAVGLALTPVSPEPFLPQRRTGHGPNDE